MNRRLKYEALAAGAILSSPIWLPRLLNRKKSPENQPVAFSRQARLAIAMGSVLMTAGLFWPRTSKESGESVIITGGSRGLGFALAKELLVRGASVTLLARNAEELTLARRKLRNSITTTTHRRPPAASRERARSPDPQRPGVADRLHTIVCDVTLETELEQAYADVLMHFGKIDLVINNAGSIVVGPLETMRADEFASQLKLHLMAPLESLRLIRPYFRKRGGGRIINICSVGGKIPVPHMATYGASKFALAGFSEIAAAELKQEGITVTTAYPGLMRTGSANQAVLKGDHEKEYLWFAAGATAPLISISAERAAKRILNASADGQSQIVVGWSAKLGSLVHACFPEIFSVLTSTVARLQPASTDSRRALGSQSRHLFDQVLNSAPLAKVKKTESESRHAHNQMPSSDPEFNLGLS